MTAAESQGEFDRAPERCSLAGSSDHLVERRSASASYLPQPVRPGMESRLGDDAMAYTVSTHTSGCFQADQRFPLRTFHAEEAHRARLSRNVPFGDQMLVNLKSYAYPAHAPYRRINEPAHIMMMNRMVCIGRHSSKLAHHEGLQHMADPYLAKQYRRGDNLQARQWPRAAARG